MIKFELSLSAQQLVIFQWIANGCQEADRREMPLFVAHVKALKADGLVTRNDDHRTNGRPPWEITPKGQLVAQVIQMEIEESRALLPGATGQRLLTKGGRHGPKDKRGNRRRSG